MDSHVLLALVLFGQLPGMGSQQATGEPAQRLPGLSGQRLNPLAQNGGGGQPIQAQRLREIRIAGVLPGRIVVRFSTAD